MSDVGGLMYDKDAVYVNVAGSFTKGNTDGTHILQQSKYSYSLSLHSFQRLKVKESKW